MPSQLDLFNDDPSWRARRTDPDTSWATARHTRPFAEAIKVLRSYARTGRALTDHDAYNLAGFNRGRFSHRRCSDLRLWGYIERVGTGVSESRHAAMVCRITTLGRKLLLDLDGGPRVE